MNRAHNRLTLPDKLIAKEYLDGSSLRFLARKYSTDKGVIKRRLIEQNIKLRSLSDANKMYAFDDTLFDSIDSHEKAYWLGFIAADGCVYKNVLKLALSKKDHDHLFKFKTFLKSNHPIHTYQIKNGKYFYSSIELRSVNMINSLIKLNVVERKSLILKPSDINIKYFSSYILGLIDGDGCFNVIKKEHLKPQIRLSFIGSENICKFICKTFEQQLNIMVSKIYKTGNVYMFQVGGNKKLKHIINYLYKNSPTYLDRKREIIDNHYQEYLLN